MNNLKNKIEQIEELEYEKKPLMKHADYNNIEKNLLNDFHKQTEKDTDSEIDWLMDIIIDNEYLITEQNEEWLGELFKFDDIDNGGFFKVDKSKYPVLNKELPSLFKDLNNDSLESLVENYEIDYSYAYSYWDRDSKFSIDFDEDLYLDGDEDNYDEIIEETKNLSNELQQQLKKQVDKNFDIECKFKYDLEDFLDKRIKQLKEIKG